MNTYNTSLGGPPMCESKATTATSSFGILDLEEKIVSVVV